MVDAYESYVQVLAPLHRDFGNLATVANPVTINPTPNAAAVPFNGRSVLVDVPRGNGMVLSSTISTGASDFTLEFKIRFNALTGDYQNLIGAGGSNSFGTVIVHNGILGVYQNGDQCSTYGLIVGQNHHIAVERVNGVFKIYLDGVCTGPSITNSASVDITHIGTDSYNWPARAYLRQVRFTIGAARYKGNFTPPEDFGPAIETVKPFLLPNVRSIFSIGSLSASAKSNMPVHKHADTYYGGTGVISGTTKVKGTPDVPVRKLVRLVRDVDGVCIRQQWSDAVTGTYRFTDIDASVKYSVISYDNNHTYRAVIADNLTPDVPA